MKEKLLRNNRFNLLNAPDNEGINQSITSTGKVKMKRSSNILRALLLTTGCICLCTCWSLAPGTKNKDVSRRAFFSHQIVASCASASAALVLLPGTTHAEGAAKLDLSDAELKDIIKNDILKRQFLVTGDLTRSVYKPTATFTDEIDTYGMDQWIKGTQRLFVGGKSDVRLVGDVEVSPDKVEFRFDEDLMFNIPFKPVVSLTGKVVLTRDETGYITSYQEFWDQDTLSVLKTAKF